MVVALIFVLFVPSAAAAVSIALVVLPSAAASTAAIELIVLLTTAETISLAATVAMHPSSILPIAFLLIVESFVVVLILQKN